MSVDDLLIPNPANMKMAGETSNKQHTTTRYIDMLQKNNSVELVTSNQMFSMFTKTNSKE